MKDKIYYHRSYKKVRSTDTALSAALKFLILVLPFDLVIIIFHPQITYLISVGVQYILTQAGFSPEMTIATWPFLYKEVHILTLPSVLPSTNLSAIVLLVSILIPLVTLRIKKLPKSFFIWLAFLCFVNFVSSAFFLLFADKFPYTTFEFSDLYMKTEIGIWIFIPAIMALALAPLPSSIFEKFFLILFIEAYSIAFGAIRYAAFLFILEKCSFLFMAVLFFNFGPFFDFVYVVGFYSLYLRGLTERLEKNMENWGWLF